MAYITDQMEPLSRSSNESENERTVHRQTLIEPRPRLRRSPGGRLGIQSFREHIRSEADESLILCTSPVE